MLIDKRAAQVTAACSTEETRPTLQGVHVRKDGTLEATDGHMLLRVALPYFDEGDLPVGWPTDDMHGAILDAKGVKAAANLVPKRSSLPILSCAAVGKNGGKTAHVVADLSEEEKTGSIRLIDSTFPNTDQVFPKGEPVVRIRFSADYLKRLAGCAEKDGHVTFTIYSPKSPVVVECSGERPITGLLMPIQIPA